MEGERREKGGEKEKREGFKFPAQGRARREERERGK